MEEYAKMYLSVYSGYAGKSTNTIQYQEAAHALHNH